MREAADRFVRQFRWRGPFELECIIDRDDVYLIEINPRFPGYIRFPVKCGLNLPYLACVTALGERPGAPPPYDLGVKYINVTAFARAVAAEIGQTSRPWMSLHRAFLSLGGYRPGLGSDLRDLQPRMGKIVAEFVDRLPFAARPTTKTGLAPNLPAYGESFTPGTRDLGDRACLGEEDGHP